MFRIRDPNAAHREKKARSRNDNLMFPCSSATACVSSGAITMVSSNDETGRLREAYKPL
jgi:hypothetical protein